MELHQKLRKKYEFPGGSICKKWKASGGHGKFDWKSRGVNFKKIDILGGGGIIFLLWKVLGPWFYVRTFL